MGPVSGKAQASEKARETNEGSKRENERKSGRNEGVMWERTMKGERRSARWNKGDETVGVCNCSGFNALLMADGTRDWGNGLHQMSLLVRGERERSERRGKEYSKRHRRFRRHMELHRFLCHRFCMLISVLLTFFSSKIIKNFEH